MIKLIKKVISVYEFIYNYLILRQNHVEYEQLPKIKGRIFLRNEGKLAIGKVVRINSKMSANPIGGDTKTIIRTKPNSILKICDGAGISNSAIICHNNIHIGENVYIGGGCRIYDTDFHSLNYGNRILDDGRDVKTAPINIEKGVFIGAGCIILKGVTIGEKSIIGAGSVVTKSIPPHQIWGGNPARFLRQLNNNELYN